MARKWDPLKGRGTIRILIIEKLEEAGPNGLHIERLATALREEGYYIPNTKYLINMLNSLKIKLDIDGETVRRK